MTRPGTTTIDHLSESECRSEIDQIDARLRELTDANEPDDQAEFDRHLARRAAISERLNRYAAIRRSAAAGHTEGPEVMRRGGDPWSTGLTSPNLYRDRALAAMERAEWVPDTARQLVTNLVEAERPDSLVARWAYETSAPAYRTAFTKLMRDPERGHLEFDSGELAAFQNVRELQRAMSLTDNAGGFLVPTHLDPAVLITSNGSLNPARDISRVVTIATDTWNGVSSAGVTASWDAEAAEVSDDSPTLAQPSIPTYKGAAFVAASIESAMDMLNIEQELVRLFADAKDVLESAAFATGSGSGQPTGIVTALTGTASVVASGTTDTLAIGDIYSTLEALPARFRPRARWTANLNIINALRKAGGANLNEFMGDLTNASPQNMLGKPLHEWSDLDGSVTALADNYVAIVGDWSNFVIVDRVGMVVEFIPHLFHTSNNRPSGQRGWYAYWRSGSDSTVDQAFRVLNCT